MSFIVHKIENVSHSTKIKTAYFWVININNEWKFRIENKYAKYLKRE